MIEVNATTAGLIVRSPRTGEEVARVPIDDADAVAAAVARARDAQRSWGAMSVRARTRHLKRVRAAFAEALDDLVAVVAEETGKSSIDATIEAAAIFPMWSYVINTAPSALRRERVPTRPIVVKKAWVERSAYGVVGVISPWNYPLAIPMQTLPWVLACGNTAVLKPSELVPRTGQLIVEVINSAGLALVEVVTGDGATGAALVAAGVDKIEFTGSGPTARRILAAAAESLTPTVMELGGKDAMIVCDDADLDRAARSAVGGAFCNAGQTCMAVERVFVDDGVWEPFMDRVLALTDALTIGADDDQHLGPLTDPRQIPVIEKRVADAVAGGATLLRGGRRIDRAGSWFAATIVTDVPPKSALALNETFGPVMLVQRVRGDHDAVTRANSSNLGLSASVFSRSKSRARAIASSLETGGVVINDAIVGAALAGVPFGGEKESGFGRLQGRAGFDEFSRRRSVVTDRLPLTPAITGSVFTGNRPPAKLIRRAVRLAWARGAGRAR